MCIVIRGICLATFHTVSLAESPRVLTERGYTGIEIIMLNVVQFYMKELCCL